MPVREIFADLSKLYKFIYNVQKAWLSFIDLYSLYNLKHIRVNVSSFGMIVFIGLDFLFQASLDTRS